jgi:hypothetical protein
MKLFDAETVGTSGGRVVTHGNSHTGTHSHTLGWLLVMATGTPFNWRGGGNGYTFQLGWRIRMEAYG